jgi:SAM-dependent methyltransferase
MKAAGVSWSTYLWRGAGGRLSRIGERLGVQWLIYNPLLFRYFHEQAVASAGGVMRTFERVFSAAQSYADIGCGSGAFAAEALRLGKTVVACEHSPVGRRAALRQGVDCRPFDLLHDPPAQLGRAFDLAYCFEVAEHLPPALGDKLVAFVAAQSRTVVFTAAQPGQGGTGHINEQPRSHWIKRFERHGFSYRPDLTAQVAEGFQAENIPSSWLIENVAVLVRD